MALNKSTSDSSKDPCGENNLKCNTLQINETKYKTVLSKKFLNRKKWEKPDTNKIYSFIPGTIIKINGKANKKVKEGEILLILEAMKMQNKILSPFNGEIKEIYVKVGDKIPKGQLMIEFKPPK